MVLFSLAAAAFSATLAGAVTIGPKSTLEIVNKAIKPDGFSRSAVLAGGTFPGPAIVANKGDSFAVNVVNKLTDTTMLTETSIHWHGIFQRDTTFYDGPVGVNQCPIKTGNSFLYSFKGGDQAGTFWYHSHDSTQYCDGLRGPLIIYDPNDPHKSKYDVDDETTILTLSDWYHQPAKQIGLIAYSDATLINGLGRSNTSTSADPLAVINVTKGKRYRFRMISTACDPFFRFQIDGHSFTIIEIEGINITPYTVDGVDVFAGQRYSFVLTADKAVNNYWIRSEPFSESPGFQSGGFANGRNMAILRYAGATVANPTTTQATIANPFIERNFVPLNAAAAPGKAVKDGADINIHLQIEADAVAGEFRINGFTFEAPPLPVLTQIRAGAKSAQELLPKGVVYELPRNKSVQLSMNGGTLGGPHPMHLHGHAFSVVRSAGQTNYNFVNPPVRDTVSAGGSTSDNVTIRFRTDNPGPWFFHCHIDWHLEAGFAVVFAEDIPGTQALPAPPTAWADLCK